MNDGIAVTAQGIGPMVIRYDEHDVGRRGGERGSEADQGNDRGAEESIHGEVVRRMSPLKQTGRAEKILFNLVPHCSSVRHG